MPQIIRSTGVRIQVLICQPLKSGLYLIYTYFYVILFDAYLDERVRVGQGVRGERTGHLQELLCGWSRGVEKWVGCEGIVEVSR